MMWSPMPDSFPCDNVFLFFFFFKDVIKSQFVKYPLFVRFGFVDAE